MRHHSNVKKFGRERGQRNALIKSLLRSLIIHERITTTVTKAKALRPHIEKLVTKAKAGDVATRRLAISRLSGVKEAKILMETIAPKYKDRQGGYTRITKLPKRKIDGADMAVIEFV
ncbi:MAG: 50S ribosomal protein L17 [Patescibacteria group bacterium]